MKLFEEKRQDTTDEGLTDEEALKRLKKYGPNELIAAHRISPVIIFFNQFKDFIVLVLMAATMISFFLGEIADAITIMVILILNAFLGFIQEYKTERSLEALKELSAPQAVVIRNGNEVIIPAREVVIGDILILETGDRVAADGILVHSWNLQVNESILTGESTPVEKKTAKITTVKGINRDYYVFMGTVITSGRARVLVTETGMKTEMGSIAGMIQNTKETVTPLQKRINKIGKELVIISLGVCVLIVFAGIYHGESVYNMFFSGVSLAVAAIPEGLPAIVTVALAIGVQRMLKRNALVRKLPAVETLGSVNVICSDKTGTLTENKMTVKNIFVNNDLIDVSGNGFSLKGDFRNKGAVYSIKNHRASKILLLTGALCNNSELRKGEIIGDPTDAAILIASKKANIDSMVNDYRRIEEIPFDSERKRMSVICSDRSGNSYLFTKGAPDMVLPVCNEVLSDSGTMMLNNTGRGKIMSVNEEMAGRALRVLGFAYKKLDNIHHFLNTDDLEKNLIFIGLEAMKDPPRQEAAESILDCYRAGIRPVMITGDHKITAVAIARELNMNTNNGSVLTGNDIEKMSDSELKNSVKNISVFARVTPKHKLRIVKAFKENKNIVAMTGDGVNDAPALKEADIGVAMGQNGTDVAKEASSMILLDDNFATIVAAVEEGRIIYDNIRKFIRYLLSCNLGEILMMAVASFLGMPMPLIPIQILWVNLVTDGLPALALGVDPPNEDIMKRPPLKSDEGIFSRGLGGCIILSGCLIGASSLASFAASMYLTGGDVIVSRTVSFAVIIIAELLYAFESRSEHKNVFQVGIFKNIYLVLAVVSSFVLMIAVLYIPALSSIFKTTPLNKNQWIVVLIFSFVEFFVDNIVPRHS